VVTETKSVTEAAAFEDYLRFGTDEERSHSSTTRRAYLWTLDLFTRFLEGRQPTPDLAKEFVKSLEAKGNVATSINRHLWALKSYFRFLKQQKPRELQKPDDDLRLRGLKTQEHYPRFLADEEWRTLLATATAPIYDTNLPEYARLRARLELALLYAYCGAGLRCSEGVRLRLDDVTDEGYLRVHRKGGREDYVPVEEQVLSAFKDYIAAKPPNGPYLFPGKSPGSHMAERTAQGIIKALCRRAGLGDVHVHSLRHTAGYQLRKGGASERDIQDFLSHKNIATTKLYTHLVREDLRARLPKRFTNDMQARMEVR